MNTNNLAFNKKRTKVIIVGKPKYYNLLGTAIQFGPLLTYLSIQYDLFRFVDGTDGGYKATGYGLVAICFVFIMFRNKIKESLKQYDESLGETWQRSKSATTTLIIAMILGITYFISFNLMWILGIYGVSTYLSLFAYAPYDKLNVLRLQMQEKLDEQNKDDNFEQMIKDFEQNKL